MTHTRYRILQAVLVTGLALFLLERLATGKLLWYINERFVVLTVVGIAGLLAMAGATLWGLRRPAHAASQADDHDHDHEPNPDHGHDHGHDHDHEHSHSPANLLWLALPLAIGLLIPARPLSVAAVASKGVALSLGGTLSAASASESAPAYQIPPEARTVLDWVRLFKQGGDLSAVVGQTANVTGFIYEDARLPHGQFLVARFTLSCCVADAFAIGMAVDWPDPPPVGAWVTVRGPVSTLEIDGELLPLIQAESVEPTAEPARPYLFP